MPLKPKKPGSGQKVFAKPQIRQKSSKLNLANVPFRSDQDGPCDDIDGMPKGKHLLKSPDALDLTEEELKEEITRVLVINHTNIPDNVVAFSHREKRFLEVSHPTNYYVLMHDEGSCFHINSEEGKAQLKMEGRYGIKPVDVKSSEDTLAKESGADAVSEDEGVNVEEGEEQIPPEEGAEDKEDAEGEREKEAEGEEPEEDIGGGEEAEAKNVIVDESVQLDMPKKKLTNQFNFCERAALTYNNPQREIGTQTVPPPRATLARLVTQWIIYDAYEEDYAHQQRLKELEKKKEKAAAGAAWTGPAHQTTKAMEPAQEPITTRMLRTAKTLERMINQNTYEEIAHDFKYWEDPSDEYREEEGTLLPLWKFYYDRTRKMNVTALTWNPRYNDLFAVGYGSFDFTKPSNEGCVCLFSLKNTSHPEYVASLWSGVCCIDFHPHGQPYLIAVGLSDGNVAVYSIQYAPPHILEKPLYRSDSVANKHASAVWQVRWGSDMPDGEITFYSVSSDSCVFCWIVSNNELSRTLVINLSLPTGPLPGPDGVTISLTACGTAVAFHPTEQNIFLVGTEEGRIYKCSTAYASLYLSTWDGHHMPVHHIDYNMYNPTIFLSCGGDWRIKIWEDNRSEPLFVFDVGSPIGDAAWAPYSSTSFAAVTWDGRAHVFDLSINKYHSICTQALVPRRRSRLTTLAFNPRQPMIIVGDDRGIVSSLKLSPNLRKRPKPPKKGVIYEPMQLEMAKLEKLLSLVREPSVLQAPVDNESVTS